MWPVLDYEIKVIKRRGNLSFNKNISRFLNWTTRRRGIRTATNVMFVKLVSKEHHSQNTRKAERVVKNFSLLFFNVSNESNITQQKIHKNKPVKEVARKKIKIHDKQLNEEVAKKRFTLFILLTKYWKLDIMLIWKQINQIISKLIILPKFLLFEKKSTEKHSETNVYYKCRIKISVWI